MKSEKELWSFSDNIMHYNIMLESGKRAGDKEGLSWNSWKLIWLALNCSLHLGNTKQSDKKCRHKTIVKTIEGPDLRLSVSLVSSQLWMISVSDSNQDLSVHNNNNYNTHCAYCIVFLCKNWSRYPCHSLLSYLN